MDWRIAGRYFESCNCEAICPCRMIGGVRGGRSTDGVCQGVISWLVDEGGSGTIPLAGLAAAMVIRYDDDEPGSPWRLRLHVDDRGDVSQQRLLVDILTGALGGPLILALPWVRKPSEILDVRPSSIDLDTGTGRVHELRIGSAVRLRASRPVNDERTVACLIPGYDRLGTELYADELVVHDGAYDWEYSGNCAFVTTFDYTSG